MIGTAGGYALLALTGLDPHALFQASTIGVRHVTVPAIEGASGRGIDPATVIFFANSTVMVVLSSFVFSVRLYDPRRIDRFSAWLRRQARQDRTMNLLKPLSSFRAIGDPSLRPLYTSLVVAPITGVSALGLLIGLLFISFTELSGAGPGRFLVTLGYLLPHGLFEVGALLLAASVPISAYLEVREDVERGDVAAAFSRVRESGAIRAVWPTLLGALIALLTAALIEANLTEFIGHNIELIIF